jgi:hypothetical protein
MVTTSMAELGTYYGFGMQLRWEDKKSIHILVEPTYWPTDVTKTPDLLDYFIFKGLSDIFLDIQPNLEIASDHIPKIVTISTHVITRQEPTKLHNSKINWEAFRNQSEENLRLNSGRN